MLQRTSGQTDWRRWSQDHPWLFAAITAAIIGLVMGLIATDDNDSVLVGILAGAMFALHSWSSVVSGDRCRSDELRAPESHSLAWEPGAANIGSCGLLRWPSSVT